jgi:hypothetical protein
MVWTAPATWVEGEIPTAAKYNTDIRDNLKAIGDAWTAYTPTWTGSGGNPAIGNGTIGGLYVAAGKLIHFKIRIVMGSTTTYGSGNYSLSLPVAIATNGVLGAQCQFIDGASLYYHGTSFLESSTTFRIGLVSNAAANITSITPTSPFTWANTDVLTVSGTYEAA